MSNHIGNRHRRMEELYDWDMEDEDEDSINIFKELETEEEEEKSRAQRRPNKERSHLEGHQRLLQDYFVQGSTYSDTDFKRRFQMRRELFLKIVVDVEAACPYFVQKPAN
ncbi:hypothetical protein PGT21_028558 [Puccinia graminis f. sp. tritici]|uniref:Uncharacterized protein n=1 Tax=Puccinia graminis f. sp. tritici TaxID=56615 RepID=A0A5B0QNU6_PUCGR|nr:hypothetical protein PGT21_028558 [Puccinia graminis f. sp. tritici]